MGTYTKPRAGAIASIASNVWAGIKRLPATIAALVCTGVGITYNASFAEQFGQAAIALAVASDLLKAMAGPMFMGAVRSREWGRAGAAVVVGLVTLTVSLVAAFGSAQHVREASTDGRQDLIRAYDAAIKKKIALEAELAVLGNPRPVAMIQADIKAFTIDWPLWKGSKQCEKPSNKSQTDYCGPLLALYKERGAAAYKTDLETKGKDGVTMAQIDAIIAKGKPAHADPQAAAIAALTGLEEDTIRISISILIVGLIETGSIGGTIMASRPVPKRRREDAALERELEDLRRKFAPEKAAPSLMLVSNDDDPTPPKPRKRSKPDERRNQVASFVGKYREKHGHDPEPVEVREATGLPRSTAWRYQQEVKAG
jgi:hypothetical protein